MQKAESTTIQDPSLNEEQKEIISEGKKVSQSKKKLRDAKLTTFQRNLQQKWEDKFEFSFEEGLKIRGKNKQVNNEVVQEFLDDLKLRLEDSKEILTRFNLNLNNCKKITNKGLGYLASHISSTFKHLKSLELNFNGCKITDGGEFNQLLSEIQSNLQGLNHFGLIVKRCRYIREDGFDAINQLIANLPNLTSLTLSYSSTGETSFEKIVDAIHHIIPSQKHLEVLKLDFEDSNRHITQQGMNQILTDITQNLPSLRVLSLNFCNSTANYSEMFFSKLSQLEKLESLDLGNFTGTLTKEDADKLNSLLKNCKNLKNLKFNFSKTYVTNAALEIFILGLMKNFLSFGKLSLDLSSCYNVSYSFIWDLKEIVKKQDIRELEVKLKGVYLGHFKEEFRILSQSSVHPKFTFLNCY